MKQRMVFLGAFAAILMVSVMAYGQRQGQGQGGRRGMGMMGRGISMAMLLRDAAVQKEIGVSEEQQSKMREVMASERQGQGERPNFQDMSQEEREKWMADRQKAAEELDKKVAEILDKKQMTRLNEIRVQALGSRAFMDEEVAKKLGISEELQEKMQTTQREAFQAAMAGGERPDREQMAKLMDDLKAKMEGMLTDKQKEDFKAMVGKPFDTSQY